MEIKISVITSLYRCREYLASFLQHLSKISNLNETEIILVHNDPTEEELEIINKGMPNSVNLIHLKVERESLYASWNRGANKAKGKYLAIWNVDDVRLPDSIINQSLALDENPSAAICYGEFIIVNKYNSTTGNIIHGPEFTASDKSFLRQHHIGCFPMWRKEIHESIGYFDEQFKLISDLDFQIRVAKRFPLIKVKKNLGFYLEGTPNNLSSNSGLQDLEHTVLHLRYGNFDLLYLPYLSLAFSNFKILQYKWFGEYHDINQYFNTTISKYIINLPLALISLLKAPRHFARRYLKKYRINK